MSEPRFTCQALGRVLLPGAPVRWRDDVVYPLKRVSEQRASVDLWTVPLSGGAARRLTTGDCVDRMARPASDGNALYFVSDRSGTDQIWVLDGRGGEATCLTAFPRAQVSALEPSPDGRWLAVILSVAHPDKSPPLAVDQVDGENDDVGVNIAGPGPSDSPVVIPAKATESPVARVIGRVMNRLDGAGWLGTRSQLWLVDTATGAARRLTRGPFDDAMPAWHGTSALVVARSRPGVEGDFDPTRGDLVVVDLDGREHLVLAPDGRPTAPSVSPDGKLVAYLLGPPDDDEGARNPLVIVSTLDGQARVLDAGLDRPAADLVLDDLLGSFAATMPPIWRDDHLIVLVTDRGAVRLRAMPLDGTPGRWLSRDDSAVSFATACDTQSLLGVVATRGTLPEIARFDATPDGYVVVGLSRHNDAVLAELAPRVPERIELPIGDGLVANAYYLAPRNTTDNATGPAPAILYIHGGPAVAYGERLFFEMHYWADRGYAVLWPNPRGGQGFGEQFAGAIVAPSSSPGGPRGVRWGGADADDLNMFTNWLKARPEVDPQRVAVVGGSYGGYMALHLAGTTDHFKTAVFERGLYDWGSSVGSSDFGHAQPRLFGGRWPWEDALGYLAQSPIRHVGNVRCPALVVHYDGDLRVGSEQAHRLFVALRRQGTPTALVIFPDEAHGMTRSGRLDRRIERYRQLEAWFERYL